MEWKVVKCQDVIDIRDGTHDTPKYVSVGYPLITSKNLKNGLIDFSEVSYISAEDHIEINKRSKVDKGDILLAMIGTIGNPVIVDVDQEFSIKNVALFKFKNSPVDPRFFKYLLESSIVKKQLERETKGGTQKFVSLKVLRNLEIPLPPIASQRTIANILDKADEIIRKRKEAIALTEQLQKSIFLDMFGDPVINPKGWEVEELNNVISIISGQVDPKVEPFIDMPHIGGENLQSNTNNIQNIKTPRELKLKSGKYLFQSGNVLYSKIRPYLNQVVITDFSGVCSADIYPLRVIETKIKNDFLIYLLRSKFFLDYAQKHSTRTNIPKINRPTLLSFRFPCPPINIQKDFSDKCNKITQIQKNFNQYLTESENLFNSLLQKAFKGEL